MRILYVVREIGLTGVVTHVRDLSAEMIRRGHTVTLLTGGKKADGDKALDNLYQSLLDTGIEIHKVSFPLSGCSRVKYMLKLLVSTCQTWLFLRRRKFDIVHLHTPVLSPVLKLCSCDFVMTRHLAGMNLGVFYVKPKYEIAISESTYRDAINAGMKQSDVFLINNGINSSFSELASSDDVSAICTRLNVPHDKIIIGFVGALCHRKGVDILLQSCDMLNTKYPDKFSLVWLGNPLKDEDRRWLSDLLERFKHPSYLRIFGYEDPKPFYDMFDIFVLPSRREGFPLVVLEAMLSGCCVVRSDTDGAQEQIADGQDGFLFKSEDSEELFLILEKLMLDKTLRESVAANGRKKALENFTSDVMAEKTLSVYNKMLS